MNKRIELERKSTYQNHVEIGIFYLPDNSHTPFVTWLIVNDDTYDGHYFERIEEATKDYQKRL